MSRDYVEVLEGLHSAMHDLLEADTETAVCERCVTIAEEVLGHRLNAIWLYDEEREALFPVAASCASAEITDELPTYRPGVGLSWEVFESGEARIVYDTSEEEGVANPDTNVRSELILPIGEYGVMNVGSTAPGTFGEVDARVAGILASDVEVALQSLARQAELRAQNERLEQFSVIVSHDLRNPMQVAMGNLDLARETGDLNHLDLVERALGRMNTLVDELLTLAQQGRVVGDLEWTSLDTASRSGWEQVDTGAATLVVESSARLAADENRLRELLENLFRNSIEHAGGGRGGDGGDKNEGGRRENEAGESGRAGGDGEGDDGANQRQAEGDGGEGGAITVRVGRLDGGFYVSDDGPGIPPEERERVFDPGFSTAPDGTGFGLSIVEQIVDAHGWKISLSEGPEGGARFEVTGVTLD